MTRCRHRWEVLARLYSPPASSFKTGGFDGRGGAVEDYFAWVRMMTLGHTDVSLRCTTCGDVATRVLEGRWEDQ